MPEHAIATCLCAGRLHSRAGRCRRRRAPHSPAPDLHLELRARFPNSPHRRGRSPRRPRRLRLLPLALRRSHRAHARPPRRHALRRPLASRRHPDRSNTSFTARSLGDLYGRVTELLGFAPTPKSTRSSGSPSPAMTASTTLFLDMLATSTATGPRIDRSYFDTDARPTEASAPRFFERLGLADGDSHPRSPPRPPRRRRAAGRRTRRHRDGRRRRQSLPRRRPGAERPAGRRARDPLRLPTTSWCSPPPATPAPPSAPSSRLARRLPPRRSASTSATSASAPATTAAEIKQVLENCKLRFRTAHHRRSDRHRRRSSLNDTRSSPGSRAAWSSAPARWATAASRLALESLFHRKSQRLHQAPRDVPQVRRLGARRARRGIFEIGPNARYLATVGRVLPGIARPSRPRCSTATCVRVHTVYRERQPALLETPARRRQGHRPARALQHLIQSLRRAASLYSARRGAQLLLLRHRRDVGRQLLPAKVI